MAGPLLSVAGYLHTDSAKRILAEAMPMPDDFNPNAAEPVERCCPECGFDPDDQKRLEEALRAVVRAWQEPGPMGTLYQMPRAISYAKSVLGEE